MWLGSTQLLDRITTQDVLLLGMCTAFSDTARNLGSRHWPQAVTGSTYLISLSIQLQSAAPTSTGGLLIVCACHQTTGPGVHLAPPGLLQLTAVRHQRRATVPRGVGPECSCVPGHWSLMVWPHHTCAAAAALAASSPANHFQDRRTGPPVASGRSTHVPRRQLQPSDIGRRPLRSGSSDIRMHNRFGDRSFTAAGPQLWNELPADLRWPNLTFPVFKQKLKMYLFGLACSRDRGALCSFVLLRCSSLCMYVLLLVLVMESLPGAFRLPSNSYSMVTNWRLSACLVTHGVCTSCIAEPCQIICLWMQWITNHERVVDMTSV